ncbi:MAG TPA: histidine kinase [Casimicrobiaceae bacterium]|nr:histidine kinase [Casimicrobiaceae bacterium]
MPDLRNLGTTLRILAAVNGAAVLAALVREPRWEAWPAAIIETAGAVEPALLVTLALLWAVAPTLARQPYRTAAFAVVAIAVFASVALGLVAQNVAPSYEGGPLRNGLFALAAVLGLLGYFQLRAKALSPAITEARLQALQARIRPHFLFNSINGVLSLVRTDPRRAEDALHDLADLFRVLMRDNRELAPLSAEVELCRQYLDLEKLRLGERLVVDWNVKSMPEDALVPPLVLQPLLENAVYHGIEPSTTPGTISINIFGTRGEVHAILRNPYRADGGRHHSGNKMAIANIRERLALHFDAEASLESRVLRDSYEVHIRMPHRVLAPRATNAGQPGQQSASSANIVDFSTERAKPRARTAIKRLEAVRG